MRCILCGVGEIPGGNNPLAICDLCSRILTEAK